MPMPDALLHVISLLLSQARAKSSHQMGIGLKGQRCRCCLALRYRTVGLIQFRGSLAEGCPLLALLRPFPGSAAGRLQRGLTPLPMGAAFNLEFECLAPTGVTAPAVTHLCLCLDMDTTDPTSDPDMRVTSQLDLRPSSSL